jgi:pimeloyl-ACP methyl ester carboxylesterase
MKNYRRYGKPPYNVAVIHGGPGAIGEMAPLAQALEPHFGVLEPFQTLATLNGQVEELRYVMETQAQLPVTLIGFSWGAWLSYILTAKHQEMVKKLILVGSGPFEHHYVKRIQETRLVRLTPEDRNEYEEIIVLLADPAGEGKRERFLRLGQLASQTDRFDPIKSDIVEKPILENNPESRAHEVLNEAQKLRRDGHLIAFADQIQVPVTAIHGDYDPHPAEGVHVPLSQRLKNFRFISIVNCGHKPWIEKQAKDKFLETLKCEILEA